MNTASETIKGSYPLFFDPLTFLLEEEQDQFVTVVLRPPDRSTRRPLSFFLSRLFIFFRPLCCIVKVRQLTWRRARDEMPTMRLRKTHFIHFPSVQFHVCMRVCVSVVYGRYDDQPRHYFAVYVHFVYVVSVLLREKRLLLLLRCLDTVRTPIIVSSLPIFQFCL